MSKKIILDTDIGTDVDDAIALTFAANSREIQLLAVTTVTDDVHFRARMAKKLLRMLGNESTEVAAGLDYPLRQRGGQRMKGHEGMGLLWPHEEVPGVASEHAVDVMARLIREHPREVSVICVGAVTNFAMALLMNPDLPALVKEFVVMGAAIQPVYMAGKPLPSYFETNLNNDPEAARIVLESGVPIAIIPAELTFNSFFHQDDIDQLRHSGHNGLHALALMCDIWRVFMIQLYAMGGGSVQEFGDRAVMLHDPLALSYLIQPGFVEFEDMRIRLETREDGKLYTVQDETGLPVKMGVRADYPGFRRFLLERLMRSAHGAGAGS